MDSSTENQSRVACIVVFRNDYKFQLNFLLISKCECLLFFSVLPNEMSDIKAVSVTSDSVSLEWKEVSSATGYMVYLLIVLYFYLLH